MKALLKGWIRSFLANPRAIATVRNSLRPFPAVDEEIRVWTYLLKKKIFRSDLGLLAADKIQTTSVSVINKQKQLLVDVSELILRDVHTGIQRVVRNILQELLSNPPTGYMVEAVYVDALGQLRYARKFSSATIDRPSAELDEPLVSIRSADVFFCPDLHMNYPFAMLAALQKRGLRIVFTTYDIIGLNKARLLPRSYSIAFTDWFCGVMSVADAIVCDSCAVADEVHSWLQDHPGQRTRSLPIGYFHLGANIEASVTTQGPIDEGAEVLAACQARPTLLMVGTLEPRKDHVQALAAVEALWLAGMDLNLVIIGKEGWRSQHLARQLRRHPERNQHLFWLENASDSLLIELYKQSSALLAASFAEGFGLPLIEAAYYGLPIIARDIPIFHEVAGEYAYYFPNTNSSDLAESIQHWLELDAQGNAPQSKGMPYLTWEQSTQQLLKVILEDNWYATYQPDEMETTSKSDSTV
ncbi:glycosyltransferase family 1 protein [Acidithiobacillus thiooxidans]|uniref:glycosyltransferase family 4 protein n=1 Tax=Acidithiobacillus thiooxidans TaxID=930 RepID=UPI00285FD8ED|nr:glycosyltransferase family 1 protein [Acidithiobacillus thiooxidans]MDR7927475.1 glycosyltransferase family 1 protein [Acidithiobacillus thiooxidans]